MIVTIRTASTWTNLFIAQVLFKSSVQRSQDRLHRREGLDVQFFSEHIFGVFCIDVFENQKKGIKVMKDVSREQKQVNNEAVHWEY